MILLPDLLKQLGEAISIPDLKLNEQGLCVLTFENRFQVILEASPQANQLLVYSFICPIPENNLAKKAELYTQLMEAHSFGVATDGGAFGASDKLGHVYFFKVIDLETTGFDRFMQALNAFIKAFELWQKKLEEMGFVHLKPSED
jgi:hypothetical protein